MLMIRGDTCQAVMSTLYQKATVGKASPCEGACIGETGRYFRDRALDRKWLCRNDYPVIELTRV